MLTTLNWFGNNLCFLFSTPPPPSISFSFFSRCASVHLPFIRSYQLRHDSDVFATCIIRTLLTSSFPFIHSFPLHRRPFAHITHIGRIFVCCSYFMCRYPLSVCALRLQQCSSSCKPNLVPSYHSGWGFSVPVMLFV